VHPARASPPVTNDDTEDMVMNTPDRILRCKDVMSLTGLSRSTLYAMMSEGTFPASIKLSKRAVGWRASVVQTWLEDKTRQPHNPHQRGE